MNILVISRGFLLFWEVFALFLSFLGSWGEYFDHFGNFIDILFSFGVFLSFKDFKRIYYHFGDQVILISFEVTRLYWSI